MARKSRKEEDVEAYRHETETRKNVVPVRLASYDTSTPKPKKYEYDPRLDPQLVWDGFKGYREASSRLTGSRRNSFAK